MNIRQAKEEIANAITAYRTRDEYGRTVIPQQRQRPVFLMGAPGIGKTAIMEQIAQENGLPLVSYSMTHHTRQSALGLPFIREREYGGEKFRVSEYTMSEIIASVYDRMEQTGLSEGILFLDEINCVSETLAPAMLQFLQYKVFGQHRVPDGWIIVTAGNPPEYNNSVREFDMVTWDRLKRIDVEPDYEVWREYAVNTGVHPAVLSYLDARKDDFYRVEATGGDKEFVTPRGWVDLSAMMRLYEQNGIDVKETLVRQYLQSAKTAKDFAIYYDLFRKYRGDYQVDTILKGAATKTLITKAGKAKFDERLGLLSMIMDALRSEVGPVMEERGILERALKELSGLKSLLKGKPGAVAEALEGISAARENELQKQSGAGMLSRREEDIRRGLCAFLAAEAAKLPRGGNNTEAFGVLKTDFNGRSGKLKKRAEQAGKAMENALAFCEKAYGEGQEILLAVTELTASEDTARFIAQYGCDAYFRHNRELLFYDRQVELIRELDLLDALENDGDAE